MVILGNISRKQDNSVKALKREAMEDAVVYLFDHDFIRSKYYNLSASAVVDIILDEQKKDLLESRPGSKNDRFFIDLYEGQDISCIDINQIDSMFLYEDLEEAVNSCLEYRGNISSEEKESGFYYRVIDLETGKVVFKTK